jgi:pantothenate kinase type III
MALSFQPGRDTAGSVCAGVSIACAGFVHMAWESAREHCGNFETIMTGGDAGMLLSRLRINAHHCPNLVLDGLAIALP